MKKTTFKLSSIGGTILVFMLCSAFYLHKKGGCDNESLMVEATSQLKKYTMIQDFPFYLKKKKKNSEIEYKKQIITLNRGVKYKFYTVRNSEFEGVPIVSIYNNEKQEFLLGSTYNSNSKKFYSELEFECKTTGNYCLSFNFQDGLEGCAIGIFASMMKE